MQDAIEIAQCDARWVRRGHLPISESEAICEVAEHPDLSVHRLHHDIQERERLVAPPLMSVPLFFVFLGVFYAWPGMPYMLPLFSGFIVGYLTTRHKSALTVALDYITVYNGPSSNKVQHGFDTLRSQLANEEDVIGAHYAERSHNHAAA